MGKACEAVFCEDESGKLTVRFGKCATGERARIMAKMVTEGVTWLPDPQPEPAKAEPAK